MRPLARWSSVGTGVHSRREGERVLLSCVSACGHCRYCREGRFGQCLGGGGWIFGHLIDGVQAEYARVPFADTSTYPNSRRGTDEQVLYLADILPTAYEVGVLNGQVRPADVVAIVGCGPIGLSALMAASSLFTPAAVVAIDTAATRRDMALDFGADVAVPPEAALEAVRGYPGDWVRTSPSKQSAFRRPSSSAPSSFDPEAAWQMSVSTASR